jgi:acyl-CoA thioesterase
MVGTVLFEFDKVMQLEAVTGTQFSGVLDGGWGVADVPNGGYVMALALRAVQATLPPTLHDPLTATAHYLKPARAGAITMDVETVKIGRRLATSAVRMFQNDVEVVRLLVTTGNLADPGAVVFARGEPPPMPALDDCTAFDAPDVVTIARRVRILYDPNTLAFARGERTGVTELRGHARFADDREPDIVSLALFADVFPPAVFNRALAPWVPTIELTVHFRARPTPGWLRCIFATRFASGGVMEEDGELWDSSGTLVAMSRQLAVAPRE